MLTEDFTDRTESSHEEYGPDELEEDLLRWCETWFKLKDYRRYRIEAQFCLGAIQGLARTLEALGYSDWLQHLMDSLPQHDNPEVEAAITAAERWMGRRVMRSGM